MTYYKRIIQNLFVGCLLVLVLTPFESAIAQSSWGVGASYETRDADPGNGFGLRLERDILSGLPVVDVRLRAHFSYFTDQVETYRDAHVPTDLDAYDFGIAATGGISFGFLKPYVGAGLGSASFNAVQTEAEEQSFSDDNIYWNLYGGVQVPILPVVKPFAEYRFTRLIGSEEFDYSHNSRVAFGIMLEF